MRGTKPNGGIPKVSTRRRYSGLFGFESLISSLRELFAQDRTVASQQDGVRCGICYLHFTVSSLIYREEEGFYVCQGCEKGLGKRDGSEGVCALRAVSFTKLLFYQGLFFGFLVLSFGNFA